MKKLALFILAGASIAILNLATPASDAVAGDNDCHRKSFKTELIKKACEEGGQKAAKKAMKQFLKKAKAAGVAKNCKGCHSDLKPKYGLKKNGLELFKKAGGK